MFLFIFSEFRSVVSEIAIEIITIISKRLTLGHVKHEFSQPVISGMLAVIFRVNTPTERYASSTFIYVV